jgi:small-conductance mechanosensitive channel
MNVTVGGVNVGEPLPLINCSIFNIVLFLVVLILGVIVARIVSNVLKRSMLRGKMDKVLVEFVCRIMRVVLYIFAVGLALAMVGINLGSVLVSVSVVLGLVLGFALGDTLANVASGMMLAVTKIFKDGDFVTVNGESGFIKHVGITVTELDTIDHKCVFIPNKLVWSNNIINYTKNKTRRVDMEVGVGYDDDLDKVIKVTMKVISAHKKVLKDPAPLVAVNEWGDSSVNLVVRPWARTDDYWDVYFDIKKTLKQAYDRAGITIPYPRTDIHIVDSNPPPKKKKST